MAHTLRTFLLCSSMLAVSVRAAAHAPPEIFEILSSAPGAAMLASTRGLIFGDPETREWSLLCSEAFGVSTGRAYHVALLDGGRLLAASPTGLQASDDNGCSWSVVPGLEGRLVPVLAQHPSEPGRLYVVAYDDAVKQSALRISEDGGQTFGAPLRTDSDAYVESLLVVPSGDGLRLYASGMMLTGMSPTPFVNYSSDGGETWGHLDLEVPNPNPNNEREAFLLAASATAPDQLLIKVTGSFPERGERVLWSRDGGRSFAPALNASGEPLVLPNVRSAAFSRDGSALYLGSMANDGGLWAATIPASSADPPAFAQVANTARIGCVGELGDELAACGYFAGLDARLDGIGTTDPSDLSFEPWMVLTDVRSPASCASSPLTEERCRPLWSDWELEMLSNVDGGAAWPPVRDGGQDAGVGSGGGLDASRRDASSGSGRDAGSSGGPSDEPSGGPSDEPSDSEDEVSEDEPGSQGNAGQESGCACGLASARGGDLSAPILLAMFAWCRRRRSRAQRLGAAGSPKASAWR